MLTQRLCFFQAPKRLLVRGAMAGGLATLATVSVAQELPKFRNGMWEFNRTVDSGAGKTQTFKTKKCTNPNEDMKKQNAMLAKAGCTFSPVTKSGTSYSFTSQCNIQGVSAQSKSLLSVDGDSAYKASIESQHGGQSSKETLVARRIGDC